MLGIVLSSLQDDYDVDKYPKQQAKGNLARTNPLLGNEED
jgi:hypothetical protein